MSWIVINNANDDGEKIEWLNVSYIGHEMDVTNTNKLAHTS